MNDLTCELEKYGALRRQVLELPRVPSPQTVRYIDIVTAQSYSLEVVVEAIVEEETGQPLAYIVDGRQESPDEQTLKQWRRNLAMRGGSSYLAIVLPGRLDIYTLGLDALSLSDACFDELFQTCLAPLQKAWKFFLDLLGGYL